MKRNIFKLLRHH